LGTPNTGLPDLGGQDDGIWLVQPGNIEQLVSQLESSARTLPGNTPMRNAARACAARWTLPKFRQSIRATA